MPLSIRWSRRVSPWKRAAFALALLSQLVHQTAVFAQEASDPGLAQQVRRMSLKELMEQEVVFAASRYDQKPSEAASAITIVTSEEIRQFGYQTIQDVLNGVRGYYMT